MTDSVVHNDVDVVIVGGGPAGLAAGLYAGRGGLKAIVLDMMGGGGQMNIIDKVENYPGVTELAMGVDLAEVMRKQMESFGTTIGFEQVEKILPEGPRIQVVGSSIYHARAVLLATGTRHKPLGVSGEGRLMGRGVSVCATCDGPFFKGRRVAVVGGGDSAVMEAIYLSRLVEHVTLIHRRDKLRAEKLLQDRFFATKNATMLGDTVVEEVVGEREVTALKLKNKKTDARSVLPVAAVFLFVGMLPNTEFLKGVLDLDESGFVLTDIRMRTSLPRCFAAGDLRKHSVRQIGAAVGDGITAMVNIQEMLDAEG